MTDFPDIKIKTLVSFPAAVFGGAGIAMVQQNGNYTFSIDFSDYPVVASVPPTNTYILAFNNISGAYSLVPISTSAGVDAPSDGNMYARKNATWVPIVTRSGHGDSNYVMQPTDLTFFQVVAGLTAPRTWQLPLSNSVPGGSLLVIQDAGGIAGANTLTIAAQGTNTFFGVGVVSNAITMAVTFGSISVRNDGVGGWYLVGKT